MNARKRTPEDPGTQTLPTRSVRVSRGRIVWWVEMGSGRASQVILTLPDDQEWERLVRERAAVRL